jgi:hypothetical protein
MKIERPPSGWNDELPPHQNPQFRQDALLVAPPYVDLVLEEVSDPGITLAVRDRRAPFVRIDVEVSEGVVFDAAATVDRIRARFAPMFEPVLSPVHVLTNGQPNVIGNPRQALPQPATDELPPRAGAAGAGITVAVIDNGIEAHDWLNGGYAAMPVDFEHEKTVDFEGRAALGPQAGHGVFLAGLVLQHAPGATVKIVRTANAWGQSDVDDVAAAILRVADLGVDVINLSLGAFTRNNRPPWALASAIAALPRSTAVVASAGNSGTHRAFWPAALPHVTAVGALAGGERGWGLAEFTNYGPWVDAYVPAVDVLSTYLDWAGDAYYRNEHGEPSTVPMAYRRWATWSGTSMAAAIWSGAVARAASELGTPASAASELLLSDPSLVSFARTLQLREDEEAEVGSRAPRRALEFDAAAVPVAA